MQPHALAFPRPWRLPTICVLVSVALHWLALDAWFRARAGFQIALPATSLRIAMPQYGVGLDTHGETSLVAAPSRVAESQSGASGAGSPREDATGGHAVAAARGASAHVEQGPMVTQTAKASNLPRTPVAPNATPRRSVAPSLASAAATAGASRGAPADAGTAARIVASPRTNVTTEPASPQPPRPTRGDDRGIQTTEQYRLALMFEARRLSAHSQYSGTGRTRLRLVFGEGGLLQSKQLVASSGDPMVDESATELLGRAQAGMPVPAALWQRAFDVEVTVSFEPR